MVYNGNNLDSIIIQIRHIMLDKGIKQIDIVQRTGLSKQTISNLLNNRQDNITLNTLYTLINAVDAEMEINILVRPNFNSLVR